MSPEQHKEFQELKKRYLNAKEYERTKYLNDSHEGRAWAEKTLLQIIKSINQLWDILTEEEKKDDFFEKL